MAESTGSAIAGAAIQTLGNYAVSAAQNKKQWKYQQQAMAKQQEYNKEIWDYQNAYNTPSEQMKRLSDAGLNPRLIYGSGSSSGGIAGPIASTDVPARRAAGADVPNLFQNHLVARQADAQYKATMQNIEMSRTTQALTQVRTALTNLDLMRQQARSKNFKDLAQAEVDTQKFIALKTAEQFANVRKQGGLMDQMFEQRGESFKETLKSQKLDNVFKQNRNDLAELGIYSTDDTKWRVLIQASHRMGIDIGELLARGAKELKYLFFDK